MIYEAREGFVISSHGWWLPGVYETRETAMYAFQFPDAVLQSLSDRICRAGREGRCITSADLKGSARTVAAV